MSTDKVTQSLLLPELRFVKESYKKKMMYIECIKVSEFEVCPHCATKSSSIYDHRYTSPRDESLRKKRVTLIIKKRRFRCTNKDCLKVFTEPIGGIKKGFRTALAGWQWAGSKTN